MRTTLSAPPAFSVRGSTPRHNSPGREAIAPRRSASAPARRPICAALAGSLRSASSADCWRKARSSSSALPIGASPSTCDRVAHVARATGTARFALDVGAAGAGGGAVSLALSSGQATPRSGSGASGALGSSSAGSGGAAAGGGTACASKGPGSNAEAAAAHHQPCARDPETPPAHPGRSLNQRT